MAWGVRQEGGEGLTVWEMFKVYDGQLHAVVRRGGALNLHRTLKDPRLLSAGLQVVGHLKGVLP